jgi:hypothetical protein
LKITLAKYPTHPHLNIITGTVMASRRLRVR